MALIEKRESESRTSYRVKVRLKGYPTQSATFERLTDARKWATQTEAAIRERRYFKHSEAKKHTLADLIDRYTRDVLPKKRVGTRVPQQAQLNWWKNQIGVFTLADITPPLLVEYRDRLSRELISKSDNIAPSRHRSPATVVRYMAVLSHAFTIAVKEFGWMEDNPMRKVSKPREPRGRMRFLSDDEAHDGQIIEGERTRLLKTCKESQNPDLYTAVVLALSTGARKMELLGLRWRQVDLNRGLITLEDTKNGERRALPLTGHALELMQSRAKVRRLDSDLVFPDPRDLEKRKYDEARTVRPIDLRVPWEAALEAAGIEDFRWHDLRHSAASYLAMSGASLAEIAEVLGHKTLAMVKRYSHLSDAHVARVVAKMNSRVFGI